jgi:hypothetical protein
MEPPKSQPSKQLELEKLRRELLQRIVASEARRKADGTSSAK